MKKLNMSNFRIMSFIHREKWINRKQNTITKIHKNGNKEIKMNFFSYQDLSRTIIVLEKMRI